jgi:hypothetical protein
MRCQLDRLAPDRDIATGCPGVIDDEGLVDALASELSR